ncbi:hypothetical protein RJ641_021938 [Dillenia turbinata]|uniref:Uncharacterized protein n=1 Tax=Dillenia turbinata TaxID=194707 RepID=A0AAN8UKU2_9MAGN
MEIDRRRRITFTKRVHSFVESDASPYRSPIFHIERQNKQKSEKENKVRHEQGSVKERNKAITLILSPQGKNNVISKLTEKHNSDCTLDLMRGDSGLLVVASETTGLLSKFLKDVIDEAVAEPPSFGSFFLAFGFFFASHFLATVFLSFVSLSETSFFPAFGAIEVIKK